MTRRRTLRRPLSAGSWSFPFRLLILLPAMVVGLGRCCGSVASEAQPEIMVWNEAERLWEPADPDIELSVIMPFYNPGDALAPTVRRAHESLTEAGVGFEIIAVSDGSTDGSEKSLEGMPPEVKVVVLPANRGKGGATPRRLRPRPRLVARLRRLRR